ncbi:hypothetical protein [Breoghania sp.]|uniref:hypothetical protein n=1 Tax=Breoghania sp. TaxID=2065378 RepID=UPI002AA95C50|nr:hypothetical protein [Breoghania sp.]
MTTPLERNQITLADLTPAQQGALANLRRSPLWRVRNGWRRQGDANRVSLATGQALLRLRLVEHTAGSLQLTPMGRLLSEEAGQRANTRKRK